MKNENSLYSFPFTLCLFFGSSGSSFLHGFSLVAVPGLLTAVALGSRVCVGSTLVTHGFSCSAARGIFLDQGSNSCLLHWQADSLPLSHQRSDQIRSVAQSCPTLCDPMNRSTPGLPVHHQLPEFTQTHVHRDSDAIQPSHPLSSPSPSAPNPSQHQSLFQ